MQDGVAIYAKISNNKLESLRRWSVYNLTWSRKELTRQKLGTFGEYYAKMALASYGLSIYTSEVDDHGIDFVAETEKGFLKFQVKTIRDETNYVFMKKQNFDISDKALYLILIRLIDSEHPTMYIIPASAWNDSGKTIFVSRDYEGKKSAPEYGLNLSKKNLPQIECYKIENIIDSI